MTLTDLTKFQQAIELAESDRREAAHALLTSLCDANPDNSRVWLCYAFTTDDLEQARGALQMAAWLDPYNSSLSAAYEWLLRQEQSHREQGAAPFIELYRDPTAPPLAKSEIVPTVRPRFDWQLWLGIGCLVAAFLIVLTQFVLPKPLTEAERSYSQSLSRLNQRANAANTAIQALIRQPPADYKGRLQLELSVFGELDTEFRRLQSPSPRFDHLDSLLILAYDHFSEGATLLSQGLATDNPALIEQGNRALAMGNDFLHQARDALNW